MFLDGMPGDLRQLQNEVGRWKPRWETMNFAGRPDTLDNTIQDITAVIILMVMYVSTATAERSFSAMKRLKNYLRTATTSERMSGLHVHNDTELDAKRIIYQKNRCILFRNK